MKSPVITSSEKRARRHGGASLIGMMTFSSTSSRPSRLRGALSSCSSRLRGSVLRDSLPRGGFTLIEMMIVILIIVIMTAITIPVMSSASDVRRAREGARVLSTMLASAQTEAQVSGRPAGVWIQRLVNSSGQVTNAAAAMDIYLAEVPPPYLGDQLTATASVQNGVAAFTNSNLLSAGVQNGDLVRFEFRGEYFVLSNIQSSSQNDTSSANITPLDSSLAGTAAASPQGNLLPFQILRHPIKTLASAVQLSDGVAVDLAWSGADVNPTAAVKPNSTQSQGVNTFWWPDPVQNTDQYWFSGVSFFYPTPQSTSSFPTPPIMTSPADSGGIVITFDSTGALGLVYVIAEVNGVTVATPYRPNSGVYLLVGKMENIPVPVQPSPPNAATPPPTNNMNLPNWNDLNSRWVSINRAGTVTTAEASVVAWNSSTPVVDSLRLARSAQSAGGQ